jgi:hypothetical protein
MKTSNIILLAFLILVFATPVFLLMSFRKKIKKGEFTVSHPSSNSYQHAGALAPFKVVKIIGLGTPGVFSCHLIPADSSWYAYNNYSNTDSIKVAQHGDTLVLKYIDADVQVNNGNVRSEQIHLGINLYAPVLNNVVVEGASVVMDSVNAALNSGINFDMRDQAFLSLGTSGQVKTTQVNNTTLTETSSALFNKVVIKASSSRVELGQFVKVSDLHLQLQGASTVSVHDNSYIDQLNGFLSDSSTVEANWKNIRRLAALTNQ